MEKFTLKLEDKDRTLKCIKSDFPFNTFERKSARNF